MGITGNAVKAFWGWYFLPETLRNHKLQSVHKYSSEGGMKVAFLARSDAERFSIIQDWFIANNIYIEISYEFYTDGVTNNWQVFVHDGKEYDSLSPLSSGSYGDNGDYTMAQARTASIKKANEIYNKLWN